MKPGAPKVMAAAGALAWLIPIVAILALVFVALLWAAFGWWTLTIIGGAGLLVSRLRK